MNTWTRFKAHYCPVPELGFALDISRIPFPDDFLTRQEPAIQAAYQAMDALEGGAVANPDENRMVGHYWLRAPQLAPTKDIALEIAGTLKSIKDFAGQIHSGALSGPRGPFRHA